jgi:hypothetical protein
MNIVLYRVSVSLHITYIRALTTRQLQRVRGSADGWRHLPVITVRVFAHAVVLIIYGSFNYAAISLDYVVSTG